ncbi:MAG TPA: FMN-binding protein [Pseudothermotoga sp.]|nr:FMN-binding protein [Pseudothermotoga sp.]HOK82850.1 FMN-binding protein [Pseudothermotoga sp.]HPP69977.1 FMN-binding protein [Pseudothermotoga sp.]
MKSFFKIAAVVLICLIVAVVLFFLIFNKGMNQIREIQIKDIDFTKIEDGQYSGQYANGRWQYVVRVTVSAGRVTNVEILNEKSGFIDMKMYKQVNDEIISRILKSQSLKVDAVTGATVTSKALLKAVENALTK